jgi:hypothetical protein
MQSKKVVVQSFCLEWHLGDEQKKLTPQGTVWSCRTASESFGLLFNRLAVALAKSQDHRASCGVFAFGLRNAVRRWLRLGYPAARANQGRERGRIARARWLKQSGIVRAMTWLHTEATSKHRANFDFDHGKAVLRSNIHHQRVDLDLITLCVYDALIPVKGNENA